MRSTIRSQLMPSKATDYVRTAIDRSQGRSVVMIHDGALLTAVHAHVAPVVTAIAVPAPPAAAIDSLVGAIV